VLRRLTCLLAVLLPATLTGTGSPQLAAENDGNGVTVSFGKADPIQPPRYEAERTTSIGKTNPYWPVKGAITVEPCRYTRCTDV